MTHKPARCLRPALALLSTLALTLPAAAGLPPEPGDLLGSTGALGGTLVELDPATGAGTPLANLGSLGPVTEIEFRADGALFGATGGGTSNLITIDTATGAESLVGQHSFGSLNALEFVDDTLYGGFFAPTGDGEAGEGVFPVSSLVTVDQETAALTLVGAMGFVPVRGLAYDAATATLYGVGPPQPEGTEGAPTDFLFTVDLATGATTAVGDTGRFLGSLEFGPDGSLYAGEVAPQAGDVEGGPAINLVLLDPATGTATTVGPTGFPGLSGLSFVPEGEQGPSAIEIPTLSEVGLGLLVLLVSLAGVVALRRRP